MKNPRKAFRSWRDSVRDAIAISKRRREFNKVLENRPYNIVQCEAAHRLAEYQASRVAPAIIGGGSDLGLPKLGHRIRTGSRIPPWYSVEVDMAKVERAGWNPGDPLDIVQHATVDEHFRVGDTYHLIPMGGDESPPLLVRISREDNSAAANICYGFLKHRNTAALINCMECHNYASEWLNRMVIPGSPPDQKSVKVGRFARVATWLVLATLAVRGLFLTSDLADIYSHIETAIEWLDLTAGG